MRPKLDPPIKRINTQVFAEDHVWLLSYYGKNHVAEVIRELVRNHRKYIEFKNSARALRMELTK